MAYQDDIQYCEWSAEAERPPGLTCDVPCLSSEGNPWNIWLNLPRRCLRWVRMWRLYAQNTPYTTISASCDWFLPCSFYGFPCWRFCNMAKIVSGVWHGAGHMSFSEKVLSDDNTSRSDKMLGWCGEGHNLLDCSISYWLDQYNKIKTSKKKKKTLKTYLLRTVIVHIMLMLHYKAEDHLLIKWPHDMT